jgi:hypothetical protein
VISKNAIKRLAKSQFGIYNCRLDFKIQRFQTKYPFAYDLKMRIFFFAFLN